MVQGPLTQLIKVNRARFSCRKKMLRTVFCSELSRSHPEAIITLDKIVADRTPLFYRNPENIIQTLQFGYFATAIAETLRRLPQAPSFRESHFGEVLATIFAEEVMGLRRIYSKLSLLTSQNSNAYKMDLVLYDPNTADPVDIVFGEVKSSPKNSPNGDPVSHDKSCFSSLFTSINDYSEDDSKYDLTAARDQVGNLPSPDKERVIRALKPYSNAKIRVVGIVVIDDTTSNNSELSVLATRKNLVEFDVDVVGIENYSDVADSVYSKLEKLRDAACLD